MRKYSILLVPIALLMVMCTLLTFVRYSTDEYQELQERRLDIVVNYAVDAAVDELVESTANLGLDYADYDRIAIEPSVALDTFIDVFLMSYGMSLSNENKTTVKTKFLPVFAIATYDGYYIAQPTMINESGAYDTIFTIKQPYLYEDKASLYALNLGLKDAKLYAGATLQKVDAPITELQQKVVISNTVSDALMETVYKQKGGQVHSTIYVPSEMTTISSTNPIDNVTVLAYLTNIDTGYGGALETFGIGGARINHQRFVGCYIKDGLKQYAYMDSVPIGIDILETYESPEIAAENGYYCDLSCFD